MLNTPLKNTNLTLSFPIEQDPESETLMIYNTLPAAFERVKVDVGFIGVEPGELQEEGKYENLIERLKAAGFDDAETVAGNAMELSEIGGDMCTSSFSTKMDFKRNEVKGSIKNLVFCLNRQPQVLQEEMKNTFKDINKMFNFAIENYNNIISSGEDEKARFFENHPNLKDMVYLLDKNEFPYSLPHILLTKTKAEAGYNKEILFNAYNHESVLSATFMHQDIFNIITADYKPGFTIYASSGVKKSDDIAVSFPDGEVFMVLPSESSEIARAGIVHEAAHSMFYMLFSNDNKPFGKNDYFMQELYLKAERSTLEKLAEVLGLTEENSDFSSYSNRELIDLIKNKSLLGLFAFKEAYDQFNSSKIDDIQLSNHVKELIKRFSDKSEEDLENIYQMTGKEQSHEIIKIINNVYSNYQNEIGSLISKFGNEELIERIYDFIYRESHEYEAELIVRVPELFTKGVNEELISYYFADMISFWKTNISPEVSKYLDSNKEQSGLEELSYNEFIVSPGENEIIQ
ncbi:hypothetical protein NF27_DP00770 [Candidatus Jidaibacter acanthamoeba]|uniref:Uncharacterized protein n=1 Tax=Candidatus Jidaibacter acanthamoebae TaxID=86105 RepID=A0A0C1QND1_9RICK|nr:hypothetical protein [Candidatus Jidaibacter acanthamoeba]KIE05533.1 hypothetical protein NF27_DP00770 [Candidatus Jidaibacter acanthamoeba]